MSATDAQKRASLRWERQYNEKITIKLRRDKDPSKEDIRVAAAAAGLSVNAFVIDAIRDKLR